MAKPTITTRASKGAALSYNELDTNFTNLQDATLTLTAGTGGTAVTADLNGVITLVAGTGVTLSGDNTAKTITINASGGSSLDVDLIEVGQADTDDVVIQADTGQNKTLILKSSNTLGSGYESSVELQPNKIVLKDGSIDLLDPSGGNTLKYGTLSVISGPTGHFNISGRLGGSINLGYGNSSDCEVGDCEIGTNTYKKIVLTNPVLLPRLSQTYINSISTPLGGMLVWNVTDSKLQVYDGSNWVNLT